MLASDGGKSITLSALAFTCPHYHRGSRGPADRAVEGEVSRVLYSRSYAEDVTSVTSGASQGPHSFNLVFVCVFVCLFVCLFVSRLALSRICPVSVATKALQDCT